MKKTARYYKFLVLELFEEFVSQATEFPEILFFSYQLKKDTIPKVERANDKAYTARQPSIELLRLFISSYNISRRQTELISGKLS